jgi:hypothetical protein
MTIDEETATLGGTPDLVATGLPVKVRVSDQTTGRDSFAEVEFSIDVIPCSNGDIAVCYESNEGRCMKGTKRCTSGWGPCEDMNFSEHQDHCGPDCEPCDKRISNKCSQGTCACGDGAACTGDEICCDSSCIDSSADSQNCGACGASCEEALQNVTNPRCENGACAHDGCAAGFLDCNGISADGCETEVSPAQCGECDRDCSTLVQNVSEILCVESGGTYDCGYAGDGTQGQGCKFGFLDCDDDRQNGCETPADSQDHCGACNNFCASKCALHPDGDRYYCGCTQDQDCGQNQQCCDDSCVNKDDLANCGSCGNDCNAQVHNVTTILCSQGACDYAECRHLYLDCDGNRQNGCEIPMSDQNCGQCGFSCGADARCEQDTCVCDANMDNCNDDWTDGCEENLLTSEEHCGDCGNDCNTQVLNVSSVYCDAGECNYAACRTEDYGDCDGNRQNGCESTLLTDAFNCGECDFRCYDYSCSSGSCLTTCTPPGAECDGDFSTHCETDTSADSQNCGGCGNDCADNIQHADGAGCLSGACNYSVCHFNYGDCDGDRTDGCETDLRTSTPHCGDCDTDCNTQVLHASSITCSNNLCNYGSCLSGYGDCDGNRQNGCETKWHVGQCGSCSIDCNTQVLHAAAITCGNGLCNYGSCNSGYGDCDDDRTNGCEINLKFDPINCGQCGKICVSPNIDCVNGNCQQT